MYNLPTESLLPACADCRTAWLKHIVVSPLRKSGIVDAVAPSPRPTRSLRCAYCRKSRRSEYAERPGTVPWAQMQTASPWVCSRYAPDQRPGCGGQLDMGELAAFVRSSPRNSKIAHSSRTGKVSPGRKTHMARSAAGPVVLLLSGARASRQFRAKPATRP